MSIEAMKQALNVLINKCDPKDETITALRTAIEQAEKQDGDCQQCGGQGCVACDARKQEPVEDLAVPSGGLEGGPEEDRIEESFWRFDARHKGYGQWKTAPMSERDAFKAEMRNALDAERTRNAEKRIAPAAPVQEQFGPQEILQMIVDRALEKPVAQRQWVSLTDEEVRETISGVHIEPLFSYRHVARAIEAKLREKNGGAA